MELDKFNELEERIKNLVDEYALLKEKNIKLEGLLQVKDEESGEAKHQIRILQEEKDTARTKVDAILAMLSAVKVP